MQQLELDLWPFGIVVAVSGRTYRLTQQVPSERWESTCHGCAFNSRTCEDNMPSNACAEGPLHDAVWKEISQV